MSALSGPPASPSGAGMRSTTASSTLATPCPVLAETSSACEASMPMVSSISALISSGRATGRSILLRIGTISRLASRAR